MRLAARSIWDTRIQAVCGIVCARADAVTEVFMSGNFAQASLDPPRIIINPNRLYPIEGVVRRAGRFSLGVMPEHALPLVRSVANVRRREPNKIDVLNVPCVEHPLGIPFVDGALQTFFCEVERVLDTGDHTIIIGRVVHQEGRAETGVRPCLYREVKETAPGVRLARTVLSRVGVMDTLRSVLYRLRPPPPPDIARNTYEDGGQTESEIQTILSHGSIDVGRPLTPGRAPGILRKRVVLCVVGTGWGLEHVRFARLASPNVAVYLCGSDEARTAGIAKRLNVEGYIVGFERAAADSRIQALTLALPHDRHRAAVELAASHGKHVLVEKPIAPSLADADAMIDAATRGGTILMVAEDMHFRPAIQLARSLIGKGVVGEPVYMLTHVAAHRRPTGWQREQIRAGGGAWMDHGVHYARAVRLLMGEPDGILASRAMQVNTRASAEDSMQVLLRSRLGWQASLFFSWIANRGPLPDIIVHGEKGVLHLYPSVRHVDFFENAPTTLTSLLSYVRPYWLQAKLQRPSHQRRRFEFTDPDPTGYVSEVREFLSAVADNRPPLTSAADGKRDLEIVLRGYDSEQQGRWVAIPEMDAVPVASR